jgi:hypothetical protein
MPVSNPSNVIENRLLAALPEADLARLLPHLDLVSLPWVRSFTKLADKCRMSTSPRIQSSLCSISWRTARLQKLVSPALRVVGIALFMGGDTTPNRAVVQSAGKAYKMRAVALRSEFARGGALQNLLLRYTQALITQISQTAVCNRLHSIEQQLCRWLLLSL